MKTRLLDQLSTSRPLARLQEELENEDSGDDESGQNQDGEANAAAETAMESVTEKEKEAEQEEKPTTRERDESRKERSRSPSKHRKPLLNPHDYELVRVAKVSNFFFHPIMRNGNKRTEKIFIDWNDNSTDIARNS